MSQPDGFTIGPPDYANEAELQRLAEIHESTPQEWDGDYVVVRERLAQWRSYLQKASTDEDMLVLVARCGGELVGMHWLRVLREEEATIAEIDSLWVDPAHRGRGIGRDLKRLGEDWARARGGERIRTQVFLANKQMIEFNLRLGFQAGGVEMTKDLRPDDRNRG